MHKIMAKSELNRKQILDNFQERLLNGYEDYCEMHHLKPNFEGMITYIIDQDLINPSVIQKYTILKEFQTRLKGDIDRGQKTQTVEVLADRFNLSTRTVWSILKNNVRR
jgi:hypothetical protein